MLIQGQLGGFRAEHCAHKTWPGEIKCMGGKSGVPLETNLFGCDPRKHGFGPNLHGSACDPRKHGACSMG